MYYRNFRREVLKGLYTSQLTRIELELMFAELTVTEKSTKGERQMTHVLVHLRTTNTTIYREQHT